MAATLEPEPSLELSLDDRTRSVLQIWGPLALYLHDEEVGAPIAQPELECGARPEEVLAVLALWHAFECRLMLDDADAIESAGLLPTGDRIHAERAAAAHALDAVRSAELAQASARGRMAGDTARDVAAFERTMTEGEIEDDRSSEASTSGRIAANVRISAIVDAHFRLIVDGKSAPSVTRRGGAKVRGLNVSHRPRSA